MKTITTLLMSSFLLAGTLNTALAVKDNRSERTARSRNEIQLKREATVERSRDVRGNTTYTTTERRTEINLPSRRQQTKIQITNRKVRQEQNNRNEQPNREVGREQNNRNEQPRADVRRNDNQPRVDYRVM